MRVPITERMSRNVQHEKGNQKGPKGMFYDMLGEQGGPKEGGLDIGQHEGLNM